MARPFDHVGFSKALQGFLLTDELEPNRKPTLASKSKTTKNDLANVEAMSKDDNTDELDGNPLPSENCDEMQGTREDPSQESGPSIKLGLRNLVTGKLPKGKETLSPSAIHVDPIKDQPSSDSGPDSENINDMEKVNKAFDLDTVLSAVKEIQIQNQEIVEMSEDEDDCANDPQETEKVVDKSGENDDNCQSCGYQHPSGLLEPGKDLKKPSNKRSKSEQGRAKTGIKTDLKRKHGSLSDKESKIRRNEPGNRKKNGSGKK